MVKSAYYSQLPTVRCRDCGQVLDFNVKHKCNGTRPDFAADQRQRMQNGSPNHQQNPNVAYGPPRPQQQQAPYSPADSYRDEAYSNGMSPHGSPHPGQLAGRGSPNAYDRDNRARGRPQDQRYYSPEQGQRSQPQDPYEPNGRQREERSQPQDPYEPNGRQREERSRYRDPSGGSQPRDPYSHSPQPRDKSRSRNDRERERPRDRSAPRGKNDLADIKTQGLDDRARRQNSGRDGRESPYTPQSAKKGSIDDVMSDLIDELSVDQRQPSPRADRPPANRGDSRNRRAPPACAGCGRDILEPKLAYMIPALQKTYHIQCFRCCVCQMSFDERNPYIPHENQPYCEADYNQALDTICGGCHQTIFERPVYALGKAWHEHHLRCAACRKPIQGNPFEHENKHWLLPNVENVVKESRGKPFARLTRLFTRNALFAQPAKIPSRTRASMSLALNHFVASITTKRTTRFVEPAMNPSKVHAQISQKSANDSIQNAGHATFAMFPSHPPTTRSDSVRTAKTTS
ncbi:hypothetical protein PhCBS80983_g03001 [Powellomyces hirtus]|uniref:LIM zinc-binding domain-containing protein n=1 Tax=Powellomyces hirtus TaxID=109895 RepID=A0A507E469_9FUNG|nr:hypothetical protein PhCBS80983_g03001 [Powellomyces hirtus]